jgi:hypothetical protein
MKRRKALVALIICGAAFAMILASCGGAANTTTSSAAPVTTGTTASEAGGGGATAPASPGVLAKYKQDMQTWVDKYNGQLTEKASVLDGISDPLSATSDQIMGVKDFASLIGEASASLKGIQPPADLSSAHQAYAEGMSTLATGLQQYAKAMQDNSATELAAAMTPMAAAAQIDDAETTLEQALGFKLTPD